jgi:hypothetical protein
MDIIDFADKVGIRTEDFLGVIKDRNWDAWEYIIHELAHWVTLGIPGELYQVEDTIAATISGIDLHGQDDNEALTCVVELEVMRQFGAPDYKDSLIKCAGTNLKAHKTNGRAWIVNQIEFYSKDPNILDYVNKVIGLLGPTKPYNGW